MHYSKQKASRKTSSALRYLLLVFLLVVAVVLLLEATNRTHFFHKAASVNAPSKPISSLPKPATSTPKTPSGNASSEKGNPTDQNGTASAAVSTNPDDWATSSSRLITLKSPLKNASLQTGFLIYGSTSVASQVQYRLIDDTAGVISEGPIGVVNGNFSANVAFTPQAKSGRLDVFNTDANGRELNEVQITVSFR